MSSPTSPPDAAETPPEERLSLATKLAFGAGDLSPAIVTIVLGFFQLFFLTTVAGLRPAVAGTILLVAKVWDAVSDPVMGWISDHTKSRHGRRRPWLLYGAVPFGLVFFLQWIVPPFGQTGTFIYYLVMVVLMSTAFTIVSVPYTALTPELTPDYNERTRLTSFRFGFSIGGSLVFGALHQVIVGAFPTMQTGYLVAGALFGAFCVLPFLWCFWGVREHYTVDTQAGIGMSVPQQLRVVFGNRPFRFVVGIYLFSWLAVQVTSAVLAFYVQFWLQRQDLFPVMILAVQGSAFVFLFVWSAVSSRIGKRLVYLIGMTFWIGVQAVLFFVQPGQVVLAVVLAVLAGVGVSVAYLIPWSMMPDVMEFDELQTGQRREGLFYGFMVLLQKLGLALGLFLVSVGLDVAGFNESLGAGQQPEMALTAIRLMIGPVPALVLVAGMALTYFYPITQQKHAEVRAQLEARKAGAEAPPET